MGFAGEISLFRRVGTVAKYWGVPPSHYFPELGTLEQVCLDEAMAIVLEAAKPPQNGNRPPGPPKSVMAFLRDPRHEVK